MPVQKPTPNLWGCRAIIGGMCVKALVTLPRVTIPIGKNGKVAVAWHKPSLIVHVLDLCTGCSACKGSLCMEGWVSDG